MLLPAYYIAYSIGKEFYPPEPTITRDPQAPPIVGGGGIGWGFALFFLSITGGFFAYILIIAGSILIFTRKPRGAFPCVIGLMTFAGIFSLIWMVDRTNQLAEVFRLLGVSIALYGIIAYVHVKRRNVS
jgi:hypothetical protein